MMNNFRLPGLFLIVALLAILVVPFWRLLPKFGMTSWISLVAIIPLGAVILLWVLAFSEPVERKASNQ